MSTATHSFLEPLPSPIGIVPSAIAQAGTILSWTPVTSINRKDSTAILTVITTDDGTSLQPGNTLLTAVRSRQKKIVWEIKNSNNQEVMVGSRNRSNKKAFDLCLATQIGVRQSLATVTPTGPRPPIFCNPVTGPKLPSLSWDLELTNTCGDGQRVVILIREQGTANLFYQASVNNKTVFKVSKKIAAVYPEASTFEVEVAKGFDMAVVSSVSIFVFPDRVLTKHNRL